MMGATTGRFFEGAAFLMGFLYELLNRNIRVWGTVYVCLGPFIWARGIVWSEQLSGRKVRSPCPKVKT